MLVAVTHNMLEDGVMISMCDVMKYYANVDASKMCSSIENTVSIGLFVIRTAFSRANKVWMLFHWNQFLNYSLLVCRNENVYPNRI